MNIKLFFKQATGDRGYMIALIVSASMLLAILILSAIEIRPSDLQVPIRNTVFGITYTYREQWYGELAFVGFAVTVWIVHTLISSRLYAVKGRSYAVPFQYLTGFILLIALIIFSAIFKVISIVQ